MKNNDKYWMEKMPGFDLETFPFCVTHGSPTYNLINVKEGYSDILTESKTMYKGQPAAILRFEGDQV